jgi:hypothetical protein
MVWWSRYPLIYSEADGFRGVSFPTSVDVGNGTLLAQNLLEWGWIAEWEAGVEFFADANQFAGGPRLMFMAGTENNSTGAGVFPQGDWNLTAAGEQMFRNAVEYMILAKPVVPVDPGTDNLVHSYTFEDGTANDSVGEAHGTLVGGAAIVDGALVTTDQDQWMEMPGDVIAINTFSEVSIEAWYTPTENANPGWSMLASFGQTNPDVDWMGINYFFMTSARDDDKSRAAISVGDTGAPWADETGVDGPELDDGILHHMVATLTATDIAFYIDGVSMGSAALDGDNLIGGISQELAYLAKGPYADPEWIGQIHEFNIYNKALSEAEVAFLAGL